MAEQKPTEQKMAVTRRRRGGKRRRALFYDEAFNGYIRDLAIERHNEILDVMEVNGISIQEAAESAGHFPERVPYHKHWRHWWLEHVQHPPGLSMDNLMARIEQAVRAGLEDERKERAETGAQTIEDTPHFQAFSSKTMTHLLREADEEMEDEM